VAGILQSIYTNVAIDGSRVWINTTAYEWYIYYSLF
jgi:hypothetical protein